MRLVFKDAILKNMPTGAENAIPACQLADKCSCTLRELRSAIELLRRDGILICSRCDNRGGYYFPRDGDETAKYFMRQLSRIGHIWAALTPFKRYLQEIPLEGQLELTELWEIHR